MNASLFFFKFSDEMDDAPERNNKYGQFPQTVGRLLRSLTKVYAQNRNYHLGHHHQHSDKLHYPERKMNDIGSADFQTKSAYSVTKLPIPHVDLDDKAKFQNTPVEGENDAE